MSYKKGQILIILLLVIVPGCEKEKEIEFGHSDLNILFLSRHWEYPCCTNYYLYKMDFNGENVSKVIDTMVLYNSYLLSNDNSKILIQYEDYENPNELILYDRDSKSFKSVDKKAGRFSGNFCWSHDDTKILYEKFENIFMYDLAFDSIIQLTNSENNFKPAFSPDGLKISFIHENDFYIMDSDGSNMKLIISDKIRRYQWSPDGEKIVFDSYDEFNISQIFIMDSNGDNIIKLTDSRIENPEADIWQIAKDGNSINMNADYIGNITPQFTKDCEKIIYLSMTDKDFSDLMVINVNGDNKQKITDSKDVPNYVKPSISPDSRFILYTIDLGGIATNQIIVVDIENGLKKNLSGERISDSGPTFDKY